MRKAAPESGNAPFTCTDVIGFLEADNVEM